MQRCLSAFVIGFGLAASSALAGPDLGFQWAHVGSPGNRGSRPEETPGDPNRSVGAVNYSYSMSKTEVTAEQWLPFVQAFSPYWDGARFDTSFTSYWIRPNTINPNVPVEYRLIAGADRYPVEVPMTMAMRFVNWLHNGRGTERAAFETGVYNMSTFRREDDYASSQIGRMAGATYGIPTFDEWAKAAFHDPNRYGQGIEGYWKYPNQSDQYPVAGLPQNGGQTNSGGVLPFGALAMDAGSYPDVQSYWGLLDASGGVSEMTETIWGVDGSMRTRTGSSYWSPNGPLEAEDMNGYSTSFLTGSFDGFRVVYVPNPSVVFGFTILVAVRKNRRP